MTTAASRSPAETLWRAVLRHGTLTPGKHCGEPPDVPHMLSCGLDLRGDKTDPDWDIDYEDGVGGHVTITGPSFHGCIVCQCGDQFGVWEWDPSPVEFVTAILEER